MRRIGLKGYKRAKLKVKRQKIKVNNSKILTTKEAKVF